MPPLSRRRSACLRLLFALWIAALGACQGSLREERAARPEGPAPPQLRCEPEPGAAGVLHLTRAEYDRTVRDLLGLTSHARRDFPADDAIGGFVAGTTTSGALVEAQVDSALALGEAFAADAESALGCAPEAAGCVDAWLPTFLRRAYRGPVSDEELGRARALYEGGAAAAGPREGLHRVVAGALASPRFLYHLPPGAGAAGEVITLDDHQLASRLAYFLWGSMPDAALFAAADEGRLASDEGLADEARRMLEDPRAREGLLAFFEQWLEVERVRGLTRDPDVYPEHDAAVSEALADSLMRFVEAVFFEGDARLSTLLTSSELYVDERLASLYGVEGVVGAELVRVELDPDRRAGLLTHPGLVALLSKDDQSDPIHRGLFVRTRLLCDELPEPPMDVDLVVEEPRPGASTRERFAAHTANPACQSCHQLIDPLGFPFEHYDALGRWRDEDQGVAIDATSDVLLTDDVDGPVDGAVELAHRLAGSWQVSECVSRQWLRFALGRVERESDACEVARLRRHLIVSGGDLRELVVEIVRGEAFRRRVVPAAALSEDP